MGLRDRIKRSISTADSSDPASTSGYVAAFVSLGRGSSFSLTLAMEIMTAVNAIKIRRFSRYLSLGYVAINARVESVISRRDFHTSGRVLCFRSGFIDRYFDRCIDPRGMLVVYSYKRNNVECYSFA